ncbi:MAG: DNA gyrase inhibitor YacG [Halobacteriovoraceae bacterium]|nr:DNA gyrase inhibitor YacG [Halobacteriovoraceae bacterium]
MNKKKKIKCPTCRKTLEYYSSKYRPFCSEKCKMIDLGHWLDESYTIPEKKEDFPEEKKDE